MDNPLNPEEFYYPFELTKGTREWKNATYKHDNTEETAETRDFIEKKPNTSRKTVLDICSFNIQIIVNNHALWKNQSRKEDAC